ncbi:uncharacterized protein SCHCODRAFT_0103600 [Schizophyllum commune H4-8]|uniref:uncharacterized protein n=1 Tax=Schizophyllum commune (strain H4-8 / FGSC 9210) TaxID=578458 RepID=UPI00216026F9
MSLPRPPSTTNSNAPHDSSYLPLHLGPSLGSLRLHATTRGRLCTIFRRRKDPQFGRDTEERLCLFLEPPTAEGVHALSGVDDSTDEGPPPPFRGHKPRGKALFYEEGHIRGNVADRTVRGERIQGGRAGPLATFRTKTSRRRPARAPLAKDVMRLSRTPKPSEARAPSESDAKRVTTFSASPSGRGRAGDYSVEGRRGGVPLLSLKQRRNTSHPRSQRRSRGADGALRGGGGGAPSPPPDIFWPLGECAPSFEGGVR